MKIRCEHNSIRLRLRKSEIVQLRAESYLECTVHFPGGEVLSWDIILKDDQANIGATFLDGKLSVQIPASTGNTWMDTDQVGMECFVPLDGEGHALHILVEKDFPCKDRPDEDKADFFSELAEDTPMNC